MKTTELYLVAPTSERNTHNARRQMLGHGVVSGLDYEYIVVEKLSSPWLVGVDMRTGETFAVGTGDFASVEDLCNKSKTKTY